MAKNEKTSKKVETIASELLRSKKTSKKVKTVAGSAYMKVLIRKRNNIN